ncbi:hypothetical protein BDB01DRAFT_801906 [Pilobolus umbonatus]|nr:hypothetical protein BDB01DRAFT_801906 [Pilobolus umbonatus]
MNPDILPVVAAGVGTLVGSMYLDAKYLLAYDVHQMISGGLSFLYHYIWEYQDRLHFYYRFKDRAKATPDKTFVIFEGRSYTYRKLEKDSNRLAHWLLTNQIKRGDVVCMMLQNHPTFFISLLAISKIGATPALINTNLSEGSLWHCISIASSKLFLFDPIYEHQASTVLDQCNEHQVRLMAYGESTEDTDIPDLKIAPTLTPSILNQYTDEDTSEVYLKGSHGSDAAYLIYTSGTTGMPKAAISQHVRVNIAMVAYSKTVGVKPDDRVYCVLPLYHSSGMIVSMSVSMYAGSTIILGRKFSARRFWNDCVDNDATVFTYIGEFCRYLLSQPPHPLENKHRIRLAYGNGMRPDVWARFKERFNIPEVCEFYAATEAPTSLFNNNTSTMGEGAVGRRGSLFRIFRSELQLILIDPITEEPLKNQKGYCIKAGWDVPGELIVRIDPKGAVQFDGYYKNKDATNKKILRDVFTKGDKYFRSGDLMRMDRDGFYYFDDRVGDTFRWKSENVATTEVAQTIGLFPGILEANVYGVLVPGHDGRAGMAALVFKEGETIDFKELVAYLKKSLPKYAVPVFLRLVPNMDVTGTFKQQKVLFREQGIDLQKLPQDEKIYWLQGDNYVPFTKNEFGIIERGQAKL